MLFVITGPSGCGKSTLAHRVLARVENLQFSVSHTTREKRDSEEEGIDYYFVSRREFERMIEDNRFYEWARVHGHYYGTSRREIEKKSAGQDLLLDIDVQGAEQIRSKLKKAVFVFIFPPHLEELKRRLEERGQESAAEIEQRLEMAKREIRSYLLFDYLIINDNLDNATQELETIILSVGYRFENRKKMVIPILRSFSEEE
jgi:guanylate kinase